MIIDHNNIDYQAKIKKIGRGKHNGAYYYSKEIVERIIPSIKTDRNWITVNIGSGLDHSIVFIHNNKKPENYEHLAKYKDVILVCGVRETMEKVKHLGKPIYLPLSVNVSEVERYKTRKTKDAAFVGRRTKRTDTLPRGIDYIENLPRTELLEEMAKYRNIYAVGRTAIEAKILGCKVLPYDKRYPHPQRWRILDSLDAAEILQEKLDRIDNNEPED